MTIRSDDVSGGYASYRMAVADEVLARNQYERAKDLYEHGAIALNDLQVAQDTEDKAKVTVDTAAEHLRLLGNDPEKPNFIVDIFAPVSGVITDQQITDQSGVQALTPPNPFTISDLSHVWIVCDVYENDLSMVHLGEKADIRLNAYPDQVFTGTINNIGPVLDPNNRTSKVRIEVRNPGFMRPGMFVVATFHGGKRETRAALPATAILHLEDRDWVYVPAGSNSLRRIEVKGGRMLSGNMQEILSGVAVGQEVVSNALEFQNTVQQ